MEKQPNKINKQKKTYREIAMEKQQIQAKSEKTTKGKIGKANYKDDNSQEEVDRVLARNRHGR